MPNSTEDAQLTILKQINSKTDRTDDTLRSLATSMQELAVAMASLKTTIEHVQKDQSIQKEVDEHQNFKIDCVEADVHDIEKRFIVTSGKVAELEKKVESQESSIKDLLKEQDVDSRNWNTVHGVGSFLAKFVVPPVIASVGSLLLFIYGGGKSG